jgi:hypothetical protein
MPPAAVVDPQPAADPTPADPQATPNTTMGT